MEKDVSNRLRRAVKENNLFLVKRLIQRIDMRNPDPGPGRYTSLAWAALKGHEEIFELLLNSGHDDEELSKDSDNNTVLIILAEIKLEQNSSGYTREGALEQRDKAIRMARLYFERYPFTLDWSNSSGKTALHMASLKGNEDFIKMLIDLGGDIDLPDMQGNTPLHYASAWGHLSVVQTLIERGCRFAARNNEGFTAVDYSYSTTTMETLEDSARQQFEKNKLARKSNFRKNNPPAARAEQGGHQGAAQQTHIPNTDQVPSSSHSRHASGPQGVSENPEPSPAVRPHHLIASLSNPPLFFSSGNPLGVAHAKLPSSDSSYSIWHGSNSQKNSSKRNQSSRSRGIATEPALGQSALTPIATRVREHDADAIAQFMDALKRKGTGNQPAVVDPSRPQIALPKNHTGNALHSGLTGARAAIHKLKQSVSAAQMRSDLPATSFPSESTPSQVDIQEFDSSEFTLTPKATAVQSPLSKRESITPPASRRSPFSLLARATSHQSVEDFNDR